MLARAGSVPVVLPRSALPARPTGRVDAIPPAGQKFDPPEHTMQTDDEHMSPSVGDSPLDDDQPTPVRGTSLSDMGLGTESEFAEDTGQRRRTRALTSTPIPR